MDRRIVSTLLTTSLLVSTSCNAPSAPDSSRHQFHSVDSRALTLPDGTECPITIDAESELLIRDVAVVEDPLRSQWTGSTANPSDGAWSFGRLMTNMAGNNDPEQFVRAWMQEWTAPRTVNGLLVPPRPMDALVLDPWRAASGGNRLDLTRAPFRLLAIVNRIDLHDLSRGSAGEGRFVFGVLGAGGGELQFTVVLEYDLPATTPAEVRRWADDFHALGSLPLGSPAYNQALEAITNRFAGRNVAPNRPNGSLIVQVRTNEIALAPIWEMREFKLTPTGELRSSPMMLTADLPFNNTPTLATFINTNTAALLDGTHVVPTSFEGRPFLAGSAIVPFGLFWNAPGIANNEARFRFSINTCNGCHSGETGTPFLHVSPRPAGVPSQLSTYLTGKVHPDPVTGTPRSMNDLETRKSLIGEVLCNFSQGIAITAPAAGATLRGPVTLSASAPAGVTSVEFFVDNFPVGMAFGPPFNVPWSADSVPFGVHTVRAVAQTQSGPVSSAPVNFQTVPSNAPDFVVTDVVAPAVARPGAPFPAQVTVCNRGDRPGSTPVDMVISRDQIFLPLAPPPVDDLLLGGQETQFLFPGECQTLSFNVPALTPPPLPGPPSNSTSFHLGAVADVFGGMPELDDQNNASAPRLIAIGFGPDLTVRLTSAPTVALPGAPLSAQATVCNQGTTPGGAPVDLVLSLDSVIALPAPGMPAGPSDDRRIGSLIVPDLAPGQCATVPLSGPASPPGPGSPGTYFLGAVVDADNVAPELNEANNASTGSRLGVGSGADFRIGTITPPFSVNQGRTFNTTVQLCNVGNAIGSAAVSVVLSLDDAIQPLLAPGPNGDQVVGTSAPIVAVPGQCVSTTVSGVSTAPGLTPGLVSVGAVADLDNTTPELDETNNAAASTVRKMGVGAGPDFVIVNSTADTNLLPGAPLSFSFQICNRGTVAGSTSVDLVASRDKTFGFEPPEPDLVLGGTSVTLSANGCTTRSLSGLTLPTGSWFLTAFADTFNTVVELNETNNTGTPVVLNVGTQPDFVVTGLTVPTSVTPGQSFRASVTICNRGTAPASATAELSLSLDAVVDPDDQRSPPITLPLLAVNACSTQAVPMLATSPLPVTATTWVGVAVDMPNTVPELNEGNNARVAAMLVGHGPDFQVTSISAPSTVTTGQPFSTTVTVCNRGTMQGSTPVDVVMSADKFLGFGPQQLDVPVGGTIVALNAGQCRSVAISAVPVGLGAMFIGAIADNDNAIVELSDTNNVSNARAITVR
jgi:subtilase family serine protease